MPFITPSAILPVNICLKPSNFTSSFCPLDLIYKRESKDSFVYILLRLPGEGTLMTHLLIIRNVLKQLSKKAVERRWYEKEVAIETGQGYPG